MAIEGSKPRQYIPGPRLAVVCRSSQKLRIRSAEHRNGVEARRSVQEVGGIHRHDVIAEVDVEQTTVRPDAEVAALDVGAH
jgi:hypothetical protein